MSAFLKSVRDNSYDLWNALSDLVGAVSEKFEDDELSSDILAAIDDANDVLNKIEKHNAAQPSAKEEKQ